ncbi:hypothetical protein E1301_Tti014203 [Triplophysa tibetana]|uniref:Uncharacterized protein n=1 Tax=Triplophysa tibetana TaxID=1572043 RepID=A0A5A9N0H1_9TELE|nr:hypothetical protein E1301_Tti014203 [Triplophysa tibetana]
MVSIQLIALFFILPNVTAEVKVTSQDYICTGDLNHVESEHAMKNPSCDQYWSYKDYSIGTFLHSMPGCHSPCKELTAGSIILTDCINITLAVICTKVHLKTSSTIEARTHFYGKMIHRSQPSSEERTHIGAYLSIGALTFISILLCAGWLHHKNKNNLTDADVTNTRL